MGCILTRKNTISEFDPEYTLVAKSFQKHKNSKDLFFGRLDFKDGQTIYQKVKCDMRIYNRWIINRS